MCRLSQETIISLLNINKDKLQSLLVKRKALLKANDENEVLKIDMAITEVEFNITRMEANLY